MNKAMIEKAYAMFLEKQARTEKLKEPHKTKVKKARRAKNKVARASRIKNK